MNRLQWLTVALVATSASTAALAQQGVTTPAKPQRMNIDANNDGVIDRAEAAPHQRLADQFTQLDKNNDGRLTADQRPQRMGKHGRRGMGGHHGGMMKADTDKDGKISRAEAVADPKLAPKFDEIDGNRDGFLDRADWQAKARERKEAWFISADGNKDGRLSQAEMEASSAKRRAEHQQKAQSHSAERFQKLDANKDGSVSREEMQSKMQR
ncbi:MAG: EF-hand domain-containing protein [Lysobacter sp.]|nr:EF-hand domain-containing protein [Lysobacter sp.]